MSNSTVRNVIRYNCQSLFLGPAPETGYNFISYTGELNNNSEELIKNHNLLKEITRVQDFGFSITLNRTDVTQLGEKSLTARPNINPAQVELNFSYLPNGLRNEARMGFHVNYGKFEYPFTGESFYEKNDQVCLLSGFDTSSLAYTYYTGVGNVWPEVGTSAGGSGAMAGADRYWPPYVYRDRRNIYAVITDGDNKDQDKHQSPLREIFNVDDSLQQVDPYSTGHHLISFGDCYLSRYSVSASVGDVMRANAAYIAENVEFHSGASGVRIPSLNLKSGNHYNVLATDGITGRPPATQATYTYFQNNQNANPKYFPPGLYTMAYVSGGYSGNKVGVDIRYTNPNTFGYVDSIQTDHHSGETKTKVSGMGTVGSGYSTSSTPPTSKFQHGGGKIGIKTEVYAATDNGSGVAYKLTPPDDIYTRMVTPLDFPEEGPIAFRQGDIKLKVPNDISGMGIDFDDAHIQNFSLEIDLNRDIMDSLGYRYPVYRGITFPVFANLNFTTFVKDTTTGSLSDTLRRGDEYDFKITVQNSCDKNVSALSTVVTGMSSPHQAGTLPLHQGKPSIVYEIKKAKLMSSSYVSNIGDPKRGDFSFQVEIDPDDLSKGLFMSGLLNVEKVEDFVLMEGVSADQDQNGGFLMREGGNSENKTLLVTNLNPLY